MSRLALSGLCVFFVLIFSSCEKIQLSMILIKAETAYNQSHFTKAIGFYKEALAIKPDKPDIHWKLGIAYYSNGDKSDCKKQIALLRELGRNDLANDLEQLFAK